MLNRSCRGPTTPARSFLFRVVAISFRHRVLSLYDWPSESGRFLASLGAPSYPFNVPRPSFAPFASRMILRDPQNHRRPPQRRDGTRTRGLCCDSEKVIGDCLKLRSADGSHVFPASNSNFSPQRKQGKMLWLASRGRPFCILARVTDDRFANEKQQTGKGEIPCRVIDDVYLTGVESRLE